MNVQRISTIIGIIAIAAVMVIGAVATWSALRPPETGPAPVAEGPSLGDLTGYVGRVDGTGRTVDVTENLHGQHPTMLVVTNDTAIVVHGKPGNFGDLTKDMPVRVFYEVRNDVKYVTSLQVIADSAQATRAPAADPLAADSKSPAEATTPPAVAAVEPKAAPPVVEPKPAAPAPEPKPPVAAKPPAPPTPTPEPKPPVASKPPVVPAPSVESKPAVAAKPPAPEPKPQVESKPPAPPAAAKPPATAGAITETRRPPETPTPRTTWVPAEPKPTLPPKPPVAATAPPPPPASVPPTVPRAVPSPAPATPTPAPPSAAASIGAPRVPPARSADSEADGSAAVDWLFQSRGR